MNYNDLTSLVASGDGSAVFVAGTMGESGSYDYATVAYDASTGKTLGTRRYNTPADGDDTPYAITSPDGSTVFVTGRSLGTSSFDYLTIAYRA